MSEKISDVPMLTADEHEIKLNGIVYGFTYRGYSDYSDRSPMFTIDAYRVISVNASARHFRVRCAKGCESEYNFKNGCATEKFYGNLVNLRIAAARRFDDSVAELDSKVSRYAKYKTQLDSEWKLLKATKPSDLKEPKAIK